MIEERVGRLVGEHRHHDRCRFCYGTEMVPFVDFGYVPLAGGFHKKGSTPEDLSNEKVYPLQVHVCKDCSLVQVNTAVSGQTLFRDHYFYFSSAIKTLADHFRDYAQELRGAFPDPSAATFLELGCNDGVFLRPLRAAGFNVVGVDPATNVVQELLDDGFDIVNDFFTERVADDVKRRNGQMDAIFSSNSFAHIDDMHDVMKGVKALLKPDGYLAFEVHYLGTLLEEMHYDMMYHEHISYYSLRAIQNFVPRFDMEVFDARRIPIHGGSVRFSVQNRGAGRRAKTDALRKMESEEAAWEVDKLETYLSFGRKVEKTKRDLLALIEGLKAQGKTIVGYGASGRATAMSAYCGLDRRFLSAVIDDAPAKQGAYTPGNHIEITDSSILAGPNRPDYALLFAWAFAEEITKKNTAFLESGGRFIVPLPDVRVIGL